MLEETQRQASSPNKETNQQCWFTSNIWHFTSQRFTLFEDISGSLSKVWNAYFIGSYLFYSL